MVISYPIFEFLVRIYNSKSKDIWRSDLNIICGISATNSKSYNKLYSVLIEEELAVQKHVRGNAHFFQVDRKALEKFIRESPHFSLIDDFIHKSMVGALT